MARPGITKNDVFEAAAQLVGRGADPTIEQVRGILGTGSNSTIAGFLREWRALHAKGETNSLNGDLPHEFIGLMKGLWQRLSNQSDSKVTAIEQQNEQRMAEIKAEIDTLKRNYSELQRQYEGIRQEKDSLIGDKLAFEQVVIKKDQHIASLTTHNDGLSAQITEKDRHLAELNRLHKQTQENLEHFRESSHEQRMLDQERHSQQLQQAEENIKQLRQELAAITQDKLTIVHQANKILHDRDALQKSQESIEKELEKLKSELSQSQKEQGENKRDAQHWQAEYEKGQKNTNEQNLILINLQKQEAVLSQQLCDAKNEARELTLQNKTLSHEKWEIAQEKAQLEGQLKQMHKMVSA